MFDSSSKSPLAFYPEQPNKSPKKAFDDVISKAMDASLGWISRLFDDITLSSYNGIDATFSPVFEELLHRNSNLCNEVETDFKKYLELLDSQGPVIKHPDSLIKTADIVWTKLYSVFFQSPPYVLRDEIRDFIGSDKLYALYRKYGITEVNQLLFAGFHNHFWQETITKFKVDNQERLDELVSEFHNDFLPETIEGSEDKKQKISQLTLSFSAYLFSLLSKLPNEIQKKHVNTSKVETVEEISAKFLSDYCVDDLPGLVELVASDTNIYKDGDDSATKKRNRLINNYIYDLMKSFMAKLFLLDGTLNPKYAELIPEDIRNLLPQDYQLSLVTELMRLHITSAMSKLPQYKDRLQYFMAQLEPSVLEASYNDIQQQFEIHNTKLRDRVHKKLFSILVANENKSLTVPDILVNSDNIFQHCFHIMDNNDIDDSSKNQRAGNQVRRVLEKLKEYISKACKDQDTNLIIAQQLVLNVEEELSTRQELYQLDRLCSHSSLCISSSQNISSQEEIFFHDLSDIRQKINTALNNTDKEFSSAPKTFTTIYQEFNSKIDPLLTQHSKRRRGENSENDENLQNRKSWFSAILPWNKIANMAKRIADRVWTKHPEAAPARAIKVIEPHKSAVKRPREEDRIILRMGILR